MALLSGFFGALATLLAAVGLYGVMSYNVSRRVSEIGIRMALGARRSMIIRMVVSESVPLLLWGLAIGAMLYFAVSRIPSSLLFQLKVSDPLTLVVACALLGGIGLLAGVVPAKRAAALDPVTALRCE